MEKLRFLSQTLHFQSPGSVPFTIVTPWPVMSESWRITTTWSSACLQPFHDFNLRSKGVPGGDVRNQPKSGERLGAYGVACAIRNASSGNGGVQIFAAPSTARRGLNLIQTGKLLAAAADIPSQM